MQQRVKREQNHTQEKRQSRKKRARRLRKIYLCGFGLFLILLIGILVYAKRPDSDIDSQVADKQEELQDARTEDGADDSYGAGEQQSGEEGSNEPEP